MKAQTNPSVSHLYAHNLSYLYFFHSLASRILGLRHLDSLSASQTITFSWFPFFFSQHDESYYNLTCQDPEHHGPFFSHYTHCKNFHLYTDFQINLTMCFLDPTSRSQAPVKKHINHIGWYQRRFVDFNFGLALALLDYLYLCT